MKENVIREKTLDFAVKVVNQYKVIQKQKREYVISRQFLRSGTSIGANVREGLNAGSKPDFIHKLGIAQKECDETLYWAELLYITNFITKDEWDLLQSDADVLLRIIRAIIMTA
jgi:four helix bundle protein